MAHKVESRINELIRQISAWAHAYYIDNEPTVPDIEYDHALKELQELESKFPHLRRADSPTLRVGSDAVEGFEKHFHLEPMLSLANAYSREDLENFFSRASRLLGQDSSKFECVVEEKMDGLAMSLTYTDGVLTKATTRGDGVAGDVVTENMRTVKSIPLRVNSAVLETLPKTFEVRGEVFMDHAGFAALNARLEKEGTKIFANPRNAAAGSVRLLDSKIVNHRPLRFFAYQIVGINVDQEVTLDLLKKSGFQINPKHYNTPGLPEIFDLVTRYESDRRENRLTYDIDGLVIKINSAHLRQELGAIANSPRWAVAYKLAPMEALTVVEKIEIQVGRTGALTPVAHLCPVLVSGVVVSRATLHNEDRIREKDVRVGDSVWIRRAGDVIPEIVRVVDSERKPGSVAFSMPSHCPECSTPVMGDKSVLYCPNPACPAKTVERLRHFCSRHAMDIRGLGENIIERLYELNYLKTIPDIYSLHKKRDELITLGGLGEKSIDRILQSIEKSKTQSPARFLYALGIELIGEKTAEDLIAATGSLPKLRSLTYEALLELPQTGAETAKSLLQAFESKLFQQELESLQKMGVMGTVAEIGSAKSSLSNALEGKTFVITGTLSKPRDYFRDLLKSHGATVTDSVSKNTHFLLAGENAGSKMQKAEKLGVHVVSESELETLLKN